MASVTVHQVGAGRADGTSGVLDEHTEVQVFAQISNDDGEPITVGVNFSVANRTEAVGLSVGAGEKQWAQFVVGALPAGTHPLDVMVYAEVDGMSQVLGQERAEFTVNGAGAAGGYVQPPELEITVFEFEAGAVEGMTPPRGEAFDTAGGVLEVQVRNLGLEQSGRATLTMVLGSEFANHEIDLAASEEVRFTLPADTLERGRVQAYAYITMEINNSSQSLDQKEMTIEVQEGPVRDDPELGTVTVDFSLAMHTTDERGASYLEHSYDPTVKFIGDDGKKSEPDETAHCDTRYGPFTCDGIVVPRSGRVLVEAVNDDGDRLTGDCYYNLGDKRVLAVNAVQMVQEIEMSASSTQELTEQVETEVRAKVSYAFVEAEGGRTWTRADSESFGEEVTGKVLYPLDTLRLEVMD
ncbi:hypothetical protein [Actinokineospora sp. UTMC 2448]|uniref:hypothetical protein n=1 Tax=Actinokineospora sp. UTMC 2448 TaxID=2268449 RepID=UPI0021646B05|nr:hypothetical protein [Actinokineospora sp. UTMC 2448]UVS81578.1 hypothetical protein Actkin_05336 [Actinokineospora sp. UTMC 2448]